MPWHVREPQAKFKGDMPRAARMRVSDLERCSITRATAVAAARRGSQVAVRRCRKGGHMASENVRTSSFVLHRCERCGLLREYSRKNVV
eukprot:2057681-Prymnesium_polylepis.2